MIVTNAQTLELRHPNPMHALHAFNAHIFQEDCGHAFEVNFLNAKFLTGNILNSQLLATPMFYLGTDRS